MRRKRNACNPVSLVDFHQSNALRVAGNDGNRVNGNANDNAVITDKHQILIALGNFEANKLAGFFGDIHCNNALAGAALNAVGVLFRTLAHAVFGDGNDAAAGFDHGHINNAVALGEFDGANTGGISAH